MIELITAILGVVGAILGYLLKKEKTKGQKARQIVAKSRAATAKGQYNNQTRSNEELEKSLDDLHGDLAAIFRVRDKKANSGD